MRPRRTYSGRGPIAVVGGGGTWAARLLRTLTGCPVKELTPCQAVAAAEKGDYFQAVVVENFEPRDPRQLSGCAAARWALATRTGVTVVGLDDGEGRRLAAALPGRVYAYSDGRPQADLTAKNVRLRGDRLEFEALTNQELIRMRVTLGDRPRLYDHLAALAGALAVGVPLERAAVLLSSGR